MLEFLKDFVIKYEMLFYLLLTAAWAGTTWYLIARKYPRKIQDVCNSTNCLECAGIVHHDKQIWREVRLFLAAALVVFVLLSLAVWSVSNQGATY